MCEDDDLAGLVSAAREAHRVWSEQLAISASGQSAEVAEAGRRFWAAYERARMRLDREIRAS